MSDKNSQDDNAQHRRAISDAAIEWLVLLGSNRITAADKDAFVRWRAESPDHETALIEARTLLHGVGETAQAQQAHQQAKHKFTPRLPVRQTIGGAMAIAACLLVVVLGISVLTPAIGPLAGLFADHATGVGERKNVVLPDGSTVYLNTASAISVDFDGNGRNIHLMAGEAVFDVAKDPERPFVVRAGQGSSTAIGTLYGVQLNDGGLTSVHVEEGLVDVSLNGRQPVRVIAGQQVIYGQGKGVSAPQDSDTATILAWRRGKLIFNRQPLGSVIAEMQRYHKGRIILMNDGLRDLQVTGVFDLAAIDALLVSLAQTTPARVFATPLATLIY
ncbi:FecR family protein [Thalassospira sp.]|uniref:FecR family protein n=1 Tax=Thalassospira sp. TaxID=1912094 RepID=UPI0027349E42|nr:FecR family protein [Thalassospira sp.]MDP2696732.1 FecR family protein [Thalassospira sp.]